MATAEALDRTAAIVALAAAREPVVVVVSALGGVTNALLAAAGQAATRDEGWRPALAAIRERHLAAVSVAADAATRQALLAAIDGAVAELGELFQGSFLLREVSARARDQIMSYGERLAAPLLAAALARRGVRAVAVDARELVLTDRRFGNAAVDLETSYARLRDWWVATSADGVVPVVTGFIAATPDGETTTMGRGGSDYTAALVGAALASPAIEIWTDVSGVLSADPRLVPAAFPLPELSYEELMELSHFGAKVVYPPTVHPARQGGIPLYIRNTFDPAHPGTRVADGVSAGDAPVRGLASISKVALARLEGDGMVGVPGIAGRLFGALAREGISVILITQASSEHSISFAVRPEDLAAAENAVAAEFRLERQVGVVDPLVVERDLAILAAVGVGMRERPGIAGRIFDVLGRHRVNVRAIAQGSSELNISLVIAASDEARALRALHAALFDGAAAPAVRVYLAGAGGVGRALLGHLTAAARPRPADGRVPSALAPLALAGVARRGRLLLAPAAGELDPATVSDHLAGALAAAEQTSALAELTAAAIAEPGPRVFVDCTASADTAALYPGLLAAGVAVVAANKRPFAAPWAAAAPLFAAARGEGGHRRVFHSTTVGAGLPFLSTVRARVAAGDVVRRLDGVFSGTISFLLNRLGAGMAFSEAVRQAHAMGYTEPDPRDDLGGDDVARKLLIMARAAGWPLEPQDLEVAPLLAAEPWNRYALAELWERLPAVDADFAARRAAAAVAGQTLAYLATLEVTASGPRATVGLREVLLDHPAATLQPGENVCVITTDVYCDLPLVVRGRGAGPVLTAAGVLADIRLAAEELSR